VTCSRGAIRLPQRHRRHREEKRKIFPVSLSICLSLFLLCVCGVCGG
jgi:hypothetical protein